MNVTETPLVAVRILTYNHEPYIAQCLESVLAQKTSFSFVIIIGEDCSQDLTADICRKYAAEFPEMISLSCNPVNNLFSNSKKNMEECVKSGAEFIALLEGDDYWSDTFKLQKQIDLLRLNPKASFCFSRTDIRFESHSADHSYFHMENYPHVIDLDGYLEHYYPIPLLTKVFRASFLTDYFSDQFKWVRRVRFMDNVMHMMDLMHGPAIFLNEITAVYRVHGSSVTRSAPKNDRWHNQEILLTHYHFIDHAPIEYRHRYVAIRSFHFEKLLNGSISDKNVKHIIEDTIGYLMDGRSGSAAHKVRSVAKIIHMHLKRNGYRTDLT